MGTFYLSTVAAFLFASQSSPVGWVNMLLANHDGHLRTGLVSLRLWPGAEANPIGTCVENLSGTEPVSETNNNPCGQVTSHK